MSPSNWLRFTARWRREAILVVIFPDSKRMLDELMKDYRMHLIDDIIEVSLSTVKKEGIIASAS